MSTLPSQEHDRVDGRRIGWIASVTLVVVALAVGVSVFPLRKRALSVGASATPNPPATIGIVEQSPIDDAHRAGDARAKQIERLSHYRFIDDTHDLAEIPIDRAMKIRAEKKR